ncbi:MAG: cysteine desulfurase NifS [Candidatus Shapirobacteria bacterium]
MSTRRIYMDYAATTPIDPLVVRMMLPYFSEKFGNTASLHQEGSEAGIALERSRKIIAKILGAKETEVYFTSSATESNNTVIKGITWANKEKGKHIIISATEHDCVMESAKWMEKQGFEVTKLPVDENGLVKIEELKKAIKKETILVSVIHANNEVGTINNIEEIGKICREAGVYFHTDASQSFGKIPIDVAKMKIDLLTASSHKIYGPKGAAILYIREGVKIEALLHGGGHEGGMRSATVNVPAIVGMAKAAEICNNEMAEESARLMQLRDKMIQNILKNIEGTRLNGDPVKRLPNNVNISFENVEGESILMMLDQEGVAVSTGSACSSRTLEPSHVLTAMGLEAKVAHGSIRFSLGRWTTEKEVNYVLEILPKIILKLRQISPFKTKI